MLSLSRTQRNQSVFDQLLIGSRLKNLIPFTQLEEQTDSVVFTAKMALDRVYFFQERVMKSLPDSMDTYIQLDCPEVRERLDPLIWCLISPRKDRRYMGSAYKSQMGAFYQTFNDVGAVDSVYRDSKANKKAISALTERICEMEVREAVTRLENKHLCINLHRLQ